MRLCEALMLSEHFDTIFKKVLPSSLSILHNLFRQFSAESLISNAAILSAGSLPKWVFEALSGKTANCIFLIAFSILVLVGLPITTPP